MQDTGAKMKLTEEQILEAIGEHLRTCDADELARIAGELCGGECFYHPSEKSSDDTEYDFNPNENYYNAFEELARRKKRAERLHFS
jgi:hypothetical protein